MRRGTIKRMLKITSGSFLLSAVVSVSAVAQTGLPERFSILPELEESLDPALCASFQYLVLSSFLGVREDSDIRGRPWPPIEGRPIEWISWQPIEGRERSAWAEIKVAGETRYLVVPELGDQDSGTTYFVPTVDQIQKLSTLFDERKRRRTPVGGPFLKMVEDIGAIQMSSGYQVTEYYATDGNDTYRYYGRGDWLTADKLLKVDPLRPAYGVRSSSDPICTVHAYPLHRDSIEVRGVSSEKRKRADFYRGWEGQANHDNGLPAVLEGPQEMSDFYDAMLSAVPRYQRYSDRPHVLYRPWAIPIFPGKCLPYAGAMLGRWSLNGAWENQKFGEIKAAMAAARKALAEHYVDSFGYDQYRAVSIARNALIYLLQKQFHLAIDGRACVAGEPDYPKADIKSYIRAVIGRADTTAAELGLALRFALLQGHWNEIEVLLDRGARTEHYDPAVGVPQSVEGKPLRPTFSARDSELFFAVHRSSITQLLVNRGMDPNTGNAFGKTPLMLAAQLDQIGTAKVLLEAGANPNVHTSAPTERQYLVRRRNRTPLMYAAQFGSLHMVELLLNKGANALAKDSDGNMPLAYGLRNRKLDEIEKLQLGVLLGNAMASGIEK